MILTVTTIFNFSCDSEKAQCEQTCKDEYQRNVMNCGNGKLIASCMSKFDGEEKSCKSRCGR